MVMTFDEVLNKSYQDVEYEVMNSEYDNYTLAQDVQQYFRESITKLKAEYAPTIEMTRAQYDTFENALKSSNEYENDFIFFIDNLDTHSKFDLGVFENELFTFKNDSRYFMRAWLHPECIKVVDDERD